MHYVDQIISSAKNVAFNQHRGELVSASDTSSYEPLLQFCLLSLNESSEATGERTLTSQLILFSSWDSPLLRNPSMLPILEELSEIELLRMVQNVDKNPTFLFDPKYNVQNFRATNQPGFFDVVCGRNPESITYQFQLPACSRTTEIAICEYYVATLDSMIDGILQEEEDPQRFLASFSQAYCSVERRREEQKVPSIYNRSLTFVRGLQRKQPLVEQRQVQYIAQESYHLGSDIAASESVTVYQVTFRRKSMLSDLERLLIQKRKDNMPKSRKRYSGPDN